MKPQTVAVVITGHGEGADLPVILGSLEHQREYNKGVSNINGGDVFWVAGKSCDLPIEIILTLDGEKNYEMDNLYLDAIIENPHEGGVGHNTREPGIKAATSDWIVLTNSDNYFMSGWRHRIEHFINMSHFGFVYWDIVSNLWAWGTQGGCKLKEGFMDLSCAVVRTDIAKRVGFPWRHYNADWDYLNACAKLCRKEGLEIIHLEQVLSVHN